MGCGCSDPARFIFRRGYRQRGRAKTAPRADPAERPRSVPMRAPVLGQSVNATTLSPRGYSAIVRLEALAAGLRGPAQRSTNVVELLMCFLHAATQTLSDSRGVLVVASEHAVSHLLVPRLRQQMRNSGTVDVWTAQTPDDVSRANRLIASRYLTRRLIWVGTGEWPRRSRGSATVPYEAAWVWCGEVAADGETTQAAGAQALQCEPIRRSAAGLQVQVGYQSSGRMISRTTLDPVWANASGTLRCSGSSEPRLHAGEYFRRDACLATRRTVNTGVGVPYMATRQTLWQGRPGSAKPLWPMHWPRIKGEGLAFEPPDLDPAGFSPSCTWHKGRVGFIGAFSADNLYHIMHHAIPASAFLESVLPSVADRAAVDPLPYAWFWPAKKALYQMWAWRLFVAGLGLPESVDALVLRSHLLIGNTSCNCYRRVYGGHSQLFGRAAEPTLFGNASLHQAQLVRFRTTVGVSFGVARQNPAARLVFLLRSGNRVIVNEKVFQADVANDSRLSSVVSFARMEELPLATQAALIYDARAIAGVHGQGLTWTAFLPAADDRPCACLEIHPEGCSHSCKSDYRDLSAMNKVQYSRLVQPLAHNCIAKYAASWRMCGNITVNSEQVRDKLAQMVALVTRPAMT